LADPLTRTPKDTAVHQKRIHMLNQWEIVMNKLIVILASCCAFGAFTTSRADDGVARSVIVHFGDLDTATWSGAATLYERLNGAAHEVCQDLEPHGQLTLRRLYKSCLQFAISNAVVAADRPVLTKYATARGVMSRPGAPAYFANEVSKRTILVAAR
jgi:UrcA family protein